MRNKPQTNTEFVTNLMEWPDSGPMMQAFVIEAIARYALEQVMAEPWGADSMINQESWKACANECLSKLGKRRDRRPTH